MTPTRLALLIVLGFVLAAPATPTATAAGGDIERLIAEVERAGLKYTNSDDGRRINLVFRITEQRTQLVSIIGDISTVGSYTYCTVFSNLYDGPVSEELIRAFTELNATELLGYWMFVPGDAGTYRISRLAHIPPTAEELSVALPHIPTRADTYEAQLTGTEDAW